MKVSPFDKVASIPCGRAIICDFAYGSPLQQGGTSTQEAPGSIDDAAELSCREDRSLCH